MCVHRIGDSSLHQSLLPALPVAAADKAGRGTHPPRIESNKHRSKECRYQWSIESGSTRLSCFLFLSKVQIQWFGDVIIQPKNSCRKCSCRQQKASLSLARPDGQHGEQGESEKHGHHLAETFFYLCSGLGGFRGIWALR